MVLCPHCNKDYKRVNLHITKSHVQYSLRRVNETTLILYKNGVKVTAKTDPEADKFISEGKKEEDNFEEYALEEDYETFIKLYDDGEVKIETESNHLNNKIIIKRKSPIVWLE